MNIDRKYKIRAVNPCSRNTHSEYDSILFLAKDKAVPAMLRAYLKESEKLGANPAHLESIGLLIGRVEQYQREVEAKTPDTDLPCEIRRCVDGEGVSDNKQDFASGAQPAPSFADAYQGAMEEVAIWKKRALEAEDLNRKFVAEVNGPTYMGEPAQPAPIAQDESVRKAWVRFSNAMVSGDDAPYPGMSEAFEQHFSQSFTDRDWRVESGTWAAAWKAAKRHEAQAQPAPSVPDERAAFAEFFCSAMRLPLDADLTQYDEAWLPWKAWKARAALAAAPEAKS